MAMKPKKVAQRGVHLALKGTKKILNRNPRIKNAIKKSIIPHIMPKDFRTDNYTRWVWQNLADYTKLPAARNDYEQMEYKPLISVIVPTYNTDEEFLRDCFNSVVGQVYENWELVIVDDASPNEAIREIIKQYAAKDNRIKYEFLKKNLHISGATNKAISIAKGEFVALFDHDDILWPTALLEVGKALNKNRKLDFLYTDEDKITEDKYHHLGPFFKPDWNPELLHSVNYITHFSIVRKTIFDKVGGFRKECDGAQDWDLFLRVTDYTKNIYHIPKIVYSWRIHDLSTAKSTDSKPYVVAAQRRAITDSLVRHGYNNAVLEVDPDHNGYWKVTYPVVGRPLISIVIPSKNQYKVVKRCLDSIYKKTTYDNFEIILVDTGSDDQRVLRLYEKLADQKNNFTLINWHEKPFSYARSCNEGARHAKGDLIVMLNNDTEVITPEWLELMAGDAQRKEIGAVGTLLLFPDGYHIQHGGVGVGLGGVAANSFSMMTLVQPMSQTQHIYLNTRHEMTAITAACLMLRKELFEEIHGFDEDYKVTYNDVDLCLRIYELGYRNLYTPYVRLIHHESISVGLPEEIAKRDTEEMRAATKKFTNQWSKYIEHDPNLNPNLDKSNAFYDLPNVNFEDRIKQKK